MTPLKRLYLVAGFEDHDVERHAAEVQRQYEDGTVRLIARPYPNRIDKRATYLRELVNSANDVVFGSADATNFCRRQDQPCALQSVNGKRGSKTCERVASGATACARSRPQLVIVICADQLYPQVFEKLGRGTLLLRMAGPALPCRTVLRAAIDAFEPAALAVVAAITNRRKSLLAPLVPHRNFQSLGRHPIAEAVQSRPAEFESVMAGYHLALYRGNFINPKKSSVRGAYMLDAETAFQEDHLHTAVQAIGAASRTDAFHLMNAYHVYGVKSDPGFHFDVMNRQGGPIVHVFHDALTGHSDGGKTTHLNATPCGRLL